MPEWITGWKRIAKYLDVSISTAYIYYKRGMPVYNKFGSVLAKPQELDEFIKKPRPGSAKHPGSAKRTKCTKNSKHGKHSGHAGQSMQSRQSVQSERTERTKRIRRSGQSRRTKCTKHSERKAA
jgi:hypothetical protein